MKSDKIKLNKSNQKDYKKKFWIFVGIIILSFLFWSSLTLQNIIIDSLDLISSFLRENWLLGILIFLFLAFLSALVSPFSSAPLIPAVILIWGKPLTFLLLNLGWLAGDVASYFIGSSAGYTIFKKYFSFEKIEYYKNKIPAKSQFWLVILFRLAVPAEITGYTLGIIRYPFSKFTLAAFLSNIPLAFLAIYLSSALMEKQPWFFFSLISLGTIFLLLMMYLFQQALRQKK